MNIATLGITGWFLLRAHIDKEDRHLDVGLGYPIDAGVYNGGFVQPLKPYMS